MKLKTIKEWQKLLKKAEGGDADAQFEVGIQYGSGIIINGVSTTAPDEKLEYDWIKRAYENGCNRTVEVYARHLSDGIHCRKDVTLAMKLYKEAMENGSSSAAHNLGIEYRDQRKYKKAFVYYKKAGEAYSDLSVGMCYYYGVGTPHDKKKALRFFKKLLQKDDISLSGYETNEANYMIGKMYLEGDVVKRSIDKARHYLLLANEDDDHPSARHLLYIIGLK